MCVCVCNVTSFYIHTKTLSKNEDWVNVHNDHQKGGGGEQREGKVKALVFVVEYIVEPLHDDHKNKTRQLVS